MNSDEQIEEHETSFYAFIFEREDNKELKKEQRKRKKQFKIRGIYYSRVTNSVFLLITFMTFSE